MYYKQIPHLQKLSLDVSYLVSPITKLTYLCVFSIINKNKYITLFFNCRGLFSFQILADLFDDQRPRSEHLGFSHNELKYVELRGCVGQMHEVELAMHFLKYVNSLEQIAFNPYPIPYLGMANGIKVVVILLIGLRKDVISFVNNFKSMSKEEQDLYFGRNQDGQNDN